ncbi:MAG: hypothetical protein V8T12_03610 [Parabacteroides johnsonii]
MNILKRVAGVALLGLLCSCNDFLDETPKSTISPENYLTEKSQLAFIMPTVYADICLRTATGATERSVPSRRTR